jgi:hypothetical protein
MKRQAFARHSLTKLFLPALAIWVVAPSIGRAASISINEYQAESAGELCGSDIHADQNGNQIAVRFSGARTGFSSPADGRARRAKCAIRIPASIPRGYYISKLTARAQSQVSKPSGIEATIQLSTSVSTLPDLSHSTELSSSRSTSGLINTYQSYTGSSLLTRSWKAALCNPGRTDETILGFDLGVFMQRSNLSSSARVDFSGSSRGIDLWTEIRPCP